METILPSLTWVILDVVTTIFFFKIHVYKSVLPACKYVQPAHVWCLQSPEENAGSPGSGIDE